MAAVWEWLPLTLAGETSCACGRFWSFECLSLLSCLAPQLKNSRRHQNGDRWWLSAVFTCIVIYMYAAVPSQSEVCLTRSSVWVSASPPSGLYQRSIIVAFAVCYLSRYMIFFFSFFVHSVRSPRCFLVGYGLVKDTVLLDSSLSITVAKSTCDSHAFPSLSFFSQISFQWSLSACTVVVGQ